MRRGGYKIRPGAPPPFIQACAAVAVMWVLWYLASFMWGGMVELIGWVVSS